MTVWVTVNHPSKRWSVLIVHTLREDHTCDRDRRVAWTVTQRTVNEEEQTSCFKLMSKDYHSEVAKFSELVSFRIFAKQLKLAKQWREAHWVGKSERSDEHLLVIRGLTRSARAGRRQARDEKWNLDSVEAVLGRIQQWKSST